MTPPKTPRNTEAREAAEALVEGRPDDATPVDAVIIIKSTTPEGGVSTEVVAQGSVQATEVQTLIELGLQSWRAKIGLR